MRENIGKLLWFYFFREKLYWGNYSKKEIDVDLMVFDVKKKRY